MICARGDQADADALHTLVDGITCDDKFGDVIRLDSLDFANNEDAKDSACMRVCVCVYIYKYVSQCCGNRKLLCCLSGSRSNGRKKANWNERLE